MGFIGPDTRGNRDNCPSEARVNYQGFREGGGSDKAHIARVFPHVITHLYPAQLIKLRCWGVLVCWVAVAGWVGVALA